MWNDLLAWLISVSGGAIVIGFIGRAALSHLFSRDVERYKATLQRESSIEIERVKAALQREHSEHVTRFEWLHARRAEALSELYRLWTEAITSIGQSAAMIRVLRELPGSTVHRSSAYGAQAARDACEAVSVAWRATRPVVPDTVADGLSQAIGTLNEVAFTITYFEELSSPNVNVVQDGDGVRQEKLDQTFRKIEADLRRLEQIDEQVVGVIRAATSSPD